MNLIYFRQFAPIRDTDVKISPYGNVYASTSLWGEREEVYIETLLEKIKEKHGISYSINLISNEYHKKKYPQYKIYTDDEILKKVKLDTKELSSHGKHPYYKDLLNSRGRISLRYVCAVEENEKIIWYCFGNRSSEYRLLSYIYEYGEEGFKRYLKERKVIQPNVNLYLSPTDPEHESEIEWQLLRKLLISNKIGEVIRIRRRHKTGWREIHDEELYIEMPRSGIKFIDLVCETETNYYVIEAKNELNWEAIGQVIGYSILFLEDNKDLDKELKKAIVYNLPDATLVHICRGLDIETYRGKDL